MDKQRMIEKYVDFIISIKEKENNLWKYYGDSSLAWEVYGDMIEFIINELLELDNEETESDTLLYTFIEWKRDRMEYDRIEDPNTGKTIETVEELMPYLEFKEIAETANSYLN